MSFTAHTSPGMWSSPSSMNGGAMQKQVIALHASALLASMFREPGHGRVAPVLGESCLSTANLAEMLGRFTRDGHDAGVVFRRPQTTAIEFVPLSHQWCGWSVAEECTTKDLTPCPDPLPTTLIPNPQSLISIHIPIVCPESSRRTLRLLLSLQLPRL